MTLAKVASNLWGSAEGDVGLVEVERRRWGTADFGRYPMVVVGRSRQTMCRRAIRQSELAMWDTKKARVVHVFGEEELARDAGDAIRTVWQTFAKRGARDSDVPGRRTPGGKSQ